MRSRSRSVRCCKRVVRPIHYARTATYDGTGVVQHLPSIHYGYHRRYHSVTSRQKRLSNKMDVGHPYDIHTALGSRFGILHCIEQGGLLAIHHFDDSSQFCRGIIYLWSLPFPREKLTSKGYRYGVNSYRNDIFVAWQPIIVNY